MLIYSDNSAISHLQRPKNTAEVLLAPLSKSSTSNQGQHSVKHRLNCFLKAL